jgi:sporulation protein YlmC with PRC-barrel domain
MAQGRETPMSFIESDRIEGTPVYSADGGRVGTIKRLIIDKSSGRVVYVVMTFGEAFGLGDATYVIPWKRLSYNKQDGGYHTDTTEAELRSAPPAAYGDAAWTTGESEEEEIFHIPPGWRAI